MDVKNIIKLSDRSKKIKEREAELREKRVTEDYFRAVQEKNFRKYKSLLDTIKKHNDKVKKDYELT